MITAAGLFIAVGIACSIFAVLYGVAYVEGILATSSPATTTNGDTMDEQQFEQAMEVQTRIAEALEEQNRLARLALSAQGIEHDEA